MKESFVFYKSFMEAVESLPEEMQLKVLKAIVNYGLYEEMNDKDPIVKAILCMVAPNIDSAKMRYEKSVINGSKGKEYGKYGGRPKTNSENILELYDTGVTQKQISKQLKISPRTVQRTIRQNPSKPLNDNVNDNVNDNNNVNNNVNNNDNDDINVNINDNVNDFDMKTYGNLKFL